MNLDVKYSELAKAAGMLQEIEASLNSSANEINTVLRNMDRKDESFAILAGKVKAFGTDLHRISGKAGRMHRGLTQIAREYQNAEKNIHSDWVRAQRTGIKESAAKSRMSRYTIPEWLKPFLPIIIPGGYIFPIIDAVIKMIMDQWKTDPANNRLGYHVNNIVFDSKGGYGGDQGHPETVGSESRRQALFDLIRKNNPGVYLDDRTLDIYLRRINDEGCGYVAMINTIFAEFAGREAEFERIFGYPMYYNGDLNFDMLLVDMYSSMDNRDANGVFDPYLDFNNEDIAKGITAESYNYWRDDTGKGTSLEERSNYLERFLGERGVNVEVTNEVNITPDNFEQYSRDGNQIIVGFRHGDLLKMNGSPKQMIKGGHAMVVTGVTDDGKYTVSSWGKQYMIDPKQDCIEYYDDNGVFQRVKTELHFQTVKYH